MSAIPSWALTTTRMTRTLHPGDTVCAERDERVETLLGSCIAIVLTDQRRTIGTMCHIVHCKPATRFADNPCAYADAAIDDMYAKLIQRGYNPQLCEAFVYGGGNMFPDRYARTNVGEDNSRWVLDRLSSDGIRVQLHDVGGNVYRRFGWTVGPELPTVISVSVQEFQ
jgi:chemotaxis protein CheD